jgi:hypothetical protein
VIVVAALVANALYDPALLDQFDHGSMSLEPAVRRSLRLGGEEIQELDLRPDRDEGILRL